jgi:hypothetical protein
MYTWLGGYNTFHAYGASGAAHFKDGEVFYHNVLNRRAEVKTNQFYESLWARFVTKMVFSGFGKSTFL